MVILNIINGVETGEVNCHCLKPQHRCSPYLCWLTIIGATRVVLEVLPELELLVGIRSTQAGQGFRSRRVEEQRRVAWSNSAGQRHVWREMVGCCFGSKPFMWSEKIMAFWGCLFLSALGIYKEISDVWSEPWPQTSLSRLHFSCRLRYLSWISKSLVHSSWQLIYFLLCTLLPSIVQATNVLTCRNMHFNCCCNERLGTTRNPLKFLKMWTCCQFCSRVTSSSFLEKGLYRLSVANCRNQPTGEFNLCGRSSSVGQ